MVKKVLAKVFLSIILAVLYLPILWIIIFSFTNTTNIADWQGFSFEAYIQLFNGAHSEKIFTAMGFTMLLALVSAILSTVLGTLAAIGVHAMRRKKLKLVYNNLSQIPMANAEIVTAIALAVMFSILRTVLNVTDSLDFVFAVFAHTSFCTPYVLLNVLPRLKRLDNSIYEAALDLGCKPFMAIRKVVLPDLMPGIVMGFVLAMTLSIDDFIISQYTINGFQTLPMFIYTMATGKKPLPVEIRALSSIMFIVILGLILFINTKNLKINSKQKEKTK